MTKEEITYLENCSIAAMNGLLSITNNPYLSEHTLASQSWIVAKAMLTERNNTIQKLNEPPDGQK